MGDCMKKLIFILIVFFAVSGCAGLGVKRGVQDNIFYSSSQPKIGIKIHPDFEYKDAKTRRSNSFDGGGTLRSTDVISERFFFKNNISRRGVTVKISRFAADRWIFKSKFFPTDNVFDHGTVPISGDTYKYSIYQAKKPSGNFLVKALGRIVGGKGNVKVCIYYYEKLDNDWGDLDDLTDHQKDILDRFISSSEKDFQILDHVVLPENS